MKSWKVHFGERSWEDHIANLIVRKGYSDSTENAFKEFPGKDGKAYVEKEKLSIKSAIELILPLGCSCPSPSSFDDARSKRNG